MKSKKRERRILLTEPEECTGCEACVLTCQATHGGKQARIRVESNEAEGVFRPVMCVGCIDQPCLLFCTFGAIKFSRRLNMPVIDLEKCSGCGDCAKACPFGVIAWEEGWDKAYKCDLCGGNPACAEVCIPGAIVFIGLNKENALRKHLNLVSSISFPNSVAEKEKRP